METGGVNDVASHKLLTAWGIVWGKRRERKSEKSKRKPPQKKEKDLLKEWISHRKRTKKPL